jgi:hypothetical protein
MDNLPDLSRNLESEKDFKSVVKAFEAMKASNILQY